MWRLGVRASILNLPSMSAGAALRTLTYHRYYAPRFALAALPALDHGPVLIGAVGSEAVDLAVAACCGSVGFSAAESLRLTGDIFAVRSSEVGAASSDFFFQSCTLVFQRGLAS